MTQIVYIYKCICVRLIISPAILEVDTMKITNVVYSAHLCISIDLRDLCQRLWNARYDPRTFPGLIWQHRNIGGNCLVFPNGVINCNGSASSADEGYQRLRRYARQLQKMGLPVKLRKVKMVTASASHSLSDILDIEMLAKERSVVYEPELFPALNFKIDGVNFCCFHTGKVVITGIKCSHQIDNVVFPALIELELYTRKKR